MTTDENPNWDSVEDLANAVRTCTDCRLNFSRTKAVPGSGSSVASILIIGEAPGFNEDQNGLPFVGRSGKLLDELLASVPVAREDVFITNVVKCRPPNNRDPLPDEVATCRPYLELQIKLINPQVIVTLGRHSLIRFYPKGKISRDHGNILQWRDRILLPLYHPAAGLRNPAIKEDLIKDVLKLPNALRESLRKTDSVSLGADEYVIRQTKKSKNVSSKQKQKTKFPNAPEPIIEHKQGESQLGMF